MMKPQRRSKENIERQPEHPIQLKSFDPINKHRAISYCQQINQLLAPLGVSAELFGSTDLEIVTKGEWEFAIYLTDEQWYPALVLLINHFGGIHTLMDDMAVLTTTLEDTEIEIIPLRGESAERNRAIMEYWRDNLAALKEYEQGKLQHAFSKREYYRWKDEYIARIVEML